MCCFLFVSLHATPCKFTIVKNKKDKTATIKSSINFEARTIEWLFAEELQVLRKKHVIISLQTKKSKIPLAFKKQKTIKMKK